MNLKPSLIALPAAFLMTALALAAVYPSHAVRSPVTSGASHTLHGLTVTDLPEIVVTPDQNAG